MDPVELKDFVATLSTEFVGRSDLRSQIRQEITQAEPGIQVLALIGDGGIGKTRLQRDLLEWAKTQTTISAASDLVDMYHFSYHTPTGMADRLVEVLSVCSKNFEEYNSLRRKRELIRSGGSNSSLLNDDVLASFVRAVRECSAQKRLVIVIDTLEKLIYFQEQRAACWYWLKESLPSWGNITLILAGRSSCQPLAKELGAKIIPVGAFSEQDSLDYFDAAARAAHKAKSSDIASYIDQFPEEFRRKAHIQSRGQPIRLALLISLISIGILPPSDTEEQRLIKELIETPDLGETVVALGRLPRGATLELLCEILEIDKEEGQRRFDAVKGLAFVKPLQEAGEETLFLHDEMYTMLNKQVYSHPIDRTVALRSNRIAVDYYRRRLKEGITQVNAVFKPIEQINFEPDISPGTRTLHEDDRVKEVAKLLGWQQALIINRVYYRFRADISGGFRYYHRYVQEAISSNDITLYLQLQAEAVIALSMCKNDQERNLIEGALCIAPVIESWTRSNYNDVIEHAKQLRVNFPLFFGLHNKGGWADSLRVREARARVYRAVENDWSKADYLLEEVIRNVSQIPLPNNQQLEEDPILWHKLSVLGLAYQTRGYLESQRGRLRQAQNDYDKAIQLWRLLKIYVEHARSLNDRGYALSLLGKSNDAKTLIKDALNMRRQIGRRGPVALSLNTLGNIYRHLGDYENALIEGWRALQLARFLGDTRTVGLSYIGLAEARRRQVSTDVDQETRLHNLRQAEDWAVMAQKIFEERAETSRRVRALIEIGCARRDQVRYLIAEIGAQEDPKQYQKQIGILARSSENALRTALKLAAELSTYDRADALIDLAWLAHYENNDSLLEEAISQALKIIPVEYHWFEPKSTSCAGKIKPTTASEAGLWQQLGKLYVLLGFRSLLSFKPDRTNNLDDISQAAYYHAMGLQYSALYSDNYPPLIQARQQMYEHYKLFNRSEHEAAAKGVIKFEGEFKEELGNEISAMRNFLINFSLWCEPPTE